MRVLDIDLDFFLADCCPLAPLHSRPDVLGHEPWSKEAVRLYIEHNLGLSKAAPITGRIFTTHDGALCFWDELIKEGRLTPPFHVTHIDAHSDLGIGRPGPRFVLENVLSRSPALRPNIAQYYKSVQLDEANYLLFALAFRYIYSLDNVRIEKSRPDIPEQIAVRDANGDYTHLQLVSAVSRLMEKTNGAEPLIPFHVFSKPLSFVTHQHYDFISLAQSPRYAPAEADALIDVIKEYMALE